VPTPKRTRALVLGGGGAVGIGWQTGLITGLRDAAVDLSAADAIVGTSAGALVGALLASGGDVFDAFRTGLSALGQNLEADALKAGAETLRSAMQQARLDADPQRALTTIGHAAREASTLAEEDYVALFGAVADTDWPTTFRCTAIDTDTGDLVVWGPDSDVPLQRAVASSCAAPALFPPVTIAGRRYMDGGILSALNTTAAPTTDALVVLSCLPLDTPGAGIDSAPGASVATPEAEIAPLRRTRRVVAVEPDFGDIGGQPNLMDLDLATQAVQIGKRQAGHESTLIQTVWNP
jgi:NTE family protein